MADVEETRLPGVGIRYDFATARGQRVGVLAHRGGERELLVYDAHDPDACRAVVRLDPAETQTLAELLGVSHVRERLSAVRQEVEGLEIDWLPVAVGSSVAGRSLADAAIRSTTGVTIVAVIRSGAAIAAPAADFVIEPGDVAVSVGTPEGIRQLAERTRRS